VIVDCAHYRDGHRQLEGPLELDAATEIIGQTDQHGFVWIGLFAPDADGLGETERRFGRHDLAVEDAQAFHLRPKVEQFEEGDTLFAVIRTARYVDDREAVDFGEVAIFCHPGF
jgi:magnesium transporter